MRSQTKGAMIQHGLNIFGEMAKEMLVRREEERQMNREVEMQKELVEARQGVESEQSQGGRQRDPSPTGDQSAEQSAHRGGGVQSGDTPQVQQKPPADGNVVETLDQASEMIEGYDRLLESAYEMEDCDMCRTIIEEARSLPLPEQQNVLPEMRDFIAAAEDGASAGELRTQLQQSEHLLPVVKQAQQ